MKAASERHRGLATIVMAGGKGERLFPLTRDKAKPAITFGGIYRIIDFTLSNCLNSGIRRIYVLTQYGSLSLDRHLRLAWDLLRPDFGEFIFSVPPQQITVNRWYRGTADSIYQNLNLLEWERPRYVLILSGDHVYKMDYLEMLNFHQVNNADMTVAAVTVPREEGRAFGVLHVDADSRVVNFLEKPAEPPGLPENPELALASMGVYIFNAETLVQEVIADAKRPDSDHDFGKDIIPRMVGKKRLFAYKFWEPEHGRPRYWRDIGRLDAYFAAHQDLLGAAPEFALHDPDWPIRGEIFTLPPAALRGDGNQVQESLLAPGCVLHNATVSRSVLSPEVEVGPGARVEEAILWQGVKVGARARVRRAIIEEGVSVPPGFAIGYDREADAQRFPVTEGGLVVVPSNVRLEA